MNTLLTLMTMFTALASAQEHTGHGRMQQQQAQPSYRRRLVITGEEARRMAESLVAQGRKWYDLSRSCSEPVYRIDGFKNVVCFDRGEIFIGGSRFKCYVGTDQIISGFRHWLFERLHNECGGDGIWPVKPDRVQ
jgi:hypothetical protein